VFLNGVNLVRGQDYTATNGTSVGALAALVASDVVEVFAYVPFNIANALTVSTVDAKGDLLVGTGADAVGRLAVGTDGQLLSAASGETSGLKWANPGMTLISTTSFTSVASHAVSSFASSTYDNYKVMLTIFTNTASDSSITIKLRLGATDNSGAAYSYAGYTKTTANADSNFVGADLTTGWRIGSLDDNAIAGTASFTGYTIDLFDIFASRWTKIVYNGSFLNASTAPSMITGAGYHASADSFNGINIISSVANMTGQVSIYGYNK
jgi:hypothetical protein